MNYISVNGKHIELTEEQVRQIVDAYKQDQTRLADVPVGEVISAGGQQMVVLEHLDGETVLIAQNTIGADTAFSDSNNNYNGSFVDDICKSFAEMMEDLVGAENVVEFNIDLTSNDGLKDYGQVRRKASLITADMYREYVDILDRHNPDKYWWLATPYTTKHHGSEKWVLCVSPSGDVSGVNCDDDDGVRPFCIFKSSIFVSR